MEETKAPVALKDSNKPYSVKLILGGSPNHDGCVIDITDAVLGAVPLKQLFDEEEGGITYSIIGIKEEVNYEPRIEVLDTPRADLFKMQDIGYILNAAIVNNSQRDAISSLIGEVFSRRNGDRLTGVKTVLSVL